jgi:hypothetical protein
MGNWEDHELDGPNDLNMYANGIAFGLAVEARWSWAALEIGLEFVSTMVEEHGHPTILYGLLVEEDLVGNRILDVLGYDEYFE